MLEGKKAVLFDLDGTLVDSLWVWTQIDIDYLARFGLKVPDDLFDAIGGMGLNEAAEYFRRRFLIRDPAEEIMVVWRQMAMDKYCNDVPLKPGAREFLLQLKERGILMAVASSNDRDLIEAVLRSHDIREFFQCVITTCEAGRGKPAPDVYLEAARRLQVSPKDCLVFEDILLGIQAGRAAGMKVCAVEDVYSAYQEKEKREAADYYIHSFDQAAAGTYEELIHA